LLEPIPALSFIDIAEIPSERTALGGGAPTVAKRVGDTAVLEYRSTETLPLVRLDVGRLCASLPTLLPGIVPKLAEKPGFSRNKGEIWRETDCLLERDGFELPVRGRGESGCRWR
jgi:hypothetical protein